MEYKIMMISPTLLQPDGVLINGVYNMDIIKQIAVTSNTAGAAVLFALTESGDVYQRIGTSWTLITPPQGVNTAEAKEMRDRMLRRPGFRPF
jgi:hypothetical protein